jgi:hypothetical protein
MPQSDEGDKYRLILNTFRQKRLTNRKIFPKGMEKTGQKWFRLEPIMDSMMNRVILHSPRREARGTV